MFAASSASGSSQYLLARIKHASASFTWKEEEKESEKEEEEEEKEEEEEENELRRRTLTRCRSLASMTVPWKNFTWVKCLLNKLSNSKSGSFLQHQRQHQLQHITCQTKVNRWG